jgi:hypothetical protein
MTTKNKPTTKSIIVCHRGYPILLSSDGKITRQLPDDSGGKTWHDVAPPEGETVVSLAVDHSALLVALCASGALYRQRKQPWHPHAGFVTEWISVEGPPS